MSSVIEVDAAVDPICNHFSNVALDAIDDTYPRLPRLSSKLNRSKCGDYRFESGLGDTDEIMSPLNRI